MPNAVNDAMKSAWEAYSATHPFCEHIDLIVCDINGVARGKWLPADQASKLWTDGVRLPVSTSALDIWGQDVDESGLGIASGDKDGVLVPVPQTLAPVPWSQRPTAQLLMTLNGTDGGPSIYDPRNTLARVLEKYRANNLTPVVATELEFYLFRARASEFDIPRPPHFASGSHLYDFVQLDKNETVLQAIQDACAAQSVPAEAAIAEYGAGQFEINFRHTSDALGAADHAFLFRRLVRGVAQTMGLEATFMAQPFSGQSGSGMHVHASLLDGDGANVFAARDGKSGAGDTLRHAVGGLLSSMADFQAVFAPSGNSFRRYSFENFSPTRINWGYDNRATSVRVPETHGPAARFEHRLCGADVNPYLALAAILHGALDGIDKGIEPCAPVEDDPQASLGNVCFEWRGAVERFTAASGPKEAFTDEYARVFSVVKQYEIGHFHDMVTDAEYKTYLGRI